MFGVIGAMEEEVSLIHKAMNVQETRSIGEIDFFKGSISGRELVLCKTGVGKVQAAHAAAVLVFHFNVQGVIFTGVAGGLRPGLKMGDIVLAQDALYHDMDASAMGWKPSEIPDGSLSVFPCDSRLNGALEKAALAVYGREHVCFGRVVTGDQFIADAAKTEELHRRFGGCAVDMEGAAVAHIASKHRVPVAIVRSISDKADGSAQIDYAAFMSSAAEKSARLIISALPALHIK